MAISDAIQDFNDGLLGAYDAIEEKDGTIPEAKNLDNLPDAIRSIPSGGPESDPYITFSTESGTNSLSLEKQLSGGLNLEYSYDTTSWTTWDLTTPLEFGGATKLYLRGTNQTLGTSNIDYTQFKFANDTTLVDCSGRVTRLLNYNGLLDYVLSKTYCFYSLFSNCKALRTAPELSSLYLTDFCYYEMFRSCTSLTTAPELPATTLATDCYQYMFYNCSSLTTAPELPATTLASGCYRSMFRNCSRLNYVKCLATNPTTSNCSNWLTSASSTGTFIKAAGVEWPSGTSGIPDNWTVEEE